MMHSCINQKHVTVFVICTMICLLGAASCTKKPTPEPGKSDAKSNPVAKSTPETPVVAATGLVPLPIELPKPQFVGTPTNIEGIANLEKPRGKARPDVLAPAGTVNLAKDKPVTSSIEEPIMGEFTWIVDGNKEATDGSLVELDPFTQHVTIDLEETCEIYAILVWHYHKQQRVYLDVVAQVASDPDFISDVQTVFNNDDDNSSGLGVGSDMNYVETSEGKLIDIVNKGVKGQYVRLYSMGNNSNDQNHYLEVEVYGKPAQ
jgi:hypothetical protein